MELKPSILEYTGSAKTFDDSGWGFKSESEYKLILFKDTSLIIEIRGVIINTDSSTMLFYQTDTQAVVSGEYQLVNSKENQIEYLCRVNNCSIKTVESVYSTSNIENKEEREEIRQLNNFKFMITKLENGNILLNFEEETKNDLFIDFHTDQKWFYNNSCI